jgi:release factor glutamine methyltransferase
MVTLFQKFNHFHATLQNIYTEPEATEISEMVFQELIGVDKMQLRNEKDRLLLLEQVKQIDSILSRLLKHEPIQYILGFAWFMNHRYTVNRHVLIPRPETEELVDWVIKENNADSNYLDIGTGSGCIAIEIKNKYKSALVQAIDISTEAIQTAKANSNKILGRNDIKFMKADALRLDDFKNSLSNSDVIVSNPPYIPLAEKDALNKNVTDNEPYLALFVPDEDYLIFYKVIASFAKHNLPSQGKVYFEIHEKMKHELTKVFSALGLENIEFKKDMYGKDRMLRLSLN